MARRKDGTYYRYGEGPDPNDVPDPTMEEIAAVAATAGLGAHAPLPRAEEFGSAPSGGNELSDEELEAQRVRLLSGGAVVGPDLAPPDMMARMTVALEALNQRREGATNDDRFISVIAMLAEAINGLKSGQLQAAQLQADMQRRVTRPENAFTPNISAYNPRGDKDFPRPVLKCPMLIPWPVEQEAHTREELELLNLLEPGEFTITRSDRSRVKLTVVIQRKLDSEEPSRLLINHETAFNNDHHKQMPFDWIRQLAMNNPKTRAAAAAVVTMEEEQAYIAAKQLNDGRLVGVGERYVSVGE